MQNLTPRVITNLPPRYDSDMERSCNPLLSTCGCLGPGGNTAARSPLEHILNATEAKDFTINGVFLEHPEWIDYEYLF